MKIMIFGLMWLVCLAAWVPTTAHGAAHHKGPELADLPKPAQKTIKTQLRGSTLLCIDASIDNGQLLYTVEMKKGGQDLSFEVDEEGLLTRIQVTLAETPKQVQKTIKSETESGTINYIDKIPDEDTPTYNIEIAKNGRDRVFTVNEDGNLLNREVFLDELPETIQKTIKTQAKTGRIANIWQMYEDEEMSYNIELTHNRKSQPFTLDDEGNLLNAVVSISDTPEPVQKAIKAKLSDAYLEQITLYIKDGKKTFEVTFTRADTIDSFEVTEDGRVIKTDEPKDAVPRVSA